MKQKDNSVKENIVAFIQQRGEIFTFNELNFPTLSCF